MNKPKFYQAIFTPPIRDIMKHVYPKHKVDLEERLPNNCECPECKKNEWWLLPTECVAVRDSGKTYIECLNCGYQTHL